jgi:hypothetical protein
MGLLALSRKGLASYLWYGQKFSSSSSVLHITVSTSVILWKGSPTHHVGIKPIWPRGPSMAYLDMTTWGILTPCRWTVLWELWVGGGHSHDFPFLYSSNSGLSRHFPYDRLGLPIILWCYECSLELAFFLALS